MFKGHEVTAHSKGRTIIRKVLQFSTCLDAAKY